MAIKRTDFIPHTGLSADQLEEVQDNGAIQCDSVTDLASLPATVKVAYVTGIETLFIYKDDDWVPVIPSPGRNLLHNGAMQVSQRGTSFAGTSGIAYTTDRWFTYRAGGATGHTVTQAASGLAQIQYCARVQRNSSNAATDAVFLEQDVETRDSIAYQGSNVTLSFWARAGSNYSSASNALGVLVQSGTGTDQRIQSGFTGASSVVSTTVALTTSWQRFTTSLTGAVPANSTQLGVRFGFTPVGTASTNDYFEITGVQLETGSVATPYEHKDYGQELRECQRYYERCSFVVNAAGQNYQNVFYKVTKRTDTPTLALTFGAITPAVASVRDRNYFTIDGLATVNAAVEITSSADL